MAVENSTVKLGRETANLKQINTVLVLYYFQYGVYFPTHSTRYSV